MAKGLTGLLDLPVEILRNIQSFLPSHGSALLTLTSKKLLTTLGTRVLHEFQGEWMNRVERQSFLLILERDLPNLYACYSCCMLHPWTDLVCRFNKKANRNGSRVCRSNDTKAEESLFASKRIHFYDLYYIMTQSNKVAQCVLLEKLGYINKKFSLEFRVVSGNLLMYGQQFVNFPYKLKDLRVCNHVAEWGCCRWMLENLDACISNMVMYEHVCMNCCTLQSCPLCPTEFMVDIVHQRGERCGLVFTRWLNLGNCSSPNDPFYRSHMVAGNARWGFMEPQPIIQYEFGSVKSAWEAVSGASTELHSPLNCDDSSEKEPQTTLHGLDEDALTNTAICV